MSFSLSEYDYELPPERIAQNPVEPRDSSRLMVVCRNTGRISEHVFRELPELLPPKTMVVANRSKVMPARFFGKRVTGGKIEFVLLERESGNIWEGLFRSPSRQKVGIRFEIETPDQEGLKGEITEVLPGRGTVVAQFDRDPLSSGAGLCALPPYIEASGDAYSRAVQRYQTLYAREVGSVAAPTAGLHFTPEVLNRLGEAGIGWAEVVLHVGYGTFRPIQADDIRQHQMHEEVFEISPEVAMEVNRTIGSGPIVAVGTTALRAVESSLDAEGRVESRRGRTSAYFYPGGPTPQVVDHLLTNFHLPKSSLYLLVCAFAGTSLIRKAYQTAIDREFRFYSYGDAMLIL